jgi:hypothetical protein
MLRDVKKTRYQVCCNPKGERSILRQRSEDVSRESTMYIALE